MSCINKVVLITGAASGFGKAIALHFAELSAKLSLFDINGENLSAVAKQCEILSKNAVFEVVVDVTKDKDIKRAIDSTVEKFETIDVLINSAGIGSFIDIENADFIKWFDSTMNVNLRATVTMTHYATNALIKSQGCVINISSVYSKMVDKNCIPYVTSKAAVTQFTKGVALELADKGVRVNCISPGFCETNLLKNSLNQTDIDTIKKNIKKSPLPRVLSVDDITEMAVFLASDKALSITGAEFVIDSGWSLLGTLLKGETIETI